MHTSIRPKYSIPAKDILVNEDVVEYPKITSDDYDDLIVDVPDVPEPEVARMPKIRKGPKQPTQVERDNHNRTHLPYRDWCKHCVQANANSNPHVYEKNLEVPEFATMHLDYWFMRNGTGEGLRTILSIKDDYSKACMGYDCEKKGRSGNLAKWIVKEIERFCHGKEKIYLKSDGENSIGDLVSEIIEVRQGITLREGSKKYDSQSNGTAEKQVQNHEKQCRVLKLAFEDRVKCRIPVEHDLITWLVSHAADLLNKYSVGIDGKTSWERIKGRCYSGDIVEFGSLIFSNTLQTFKVAT